MSRTDSRVAFREDPHSSSEPEYMKLWHIVCTVVLRRTAGTYVFMFLPNWQICGRYLQQLCKNACEIYAQQYLSHFCDK
jgi:hypothetical protein